MPETRTENSRPIRIGVQLQPQHADYPAIRRAVARAEELGVDVVFNWDHFFPLSGDPDGKHFECWTMLAAWAEATERVEIGALVTCNGYRNPELLADMARTVDHISDGRLILGHRLGLEAAGLRRVRLRVRHRRRAGSTTWPSRCRGSSRAWATLNPPPTRKIPVLIGGGGEKKTLRLVARHADIWHTFSDGETSTTSRGARGLVRTRGSRPQRDRALDRTSGVADRSRSPMRLLAQARRCSPSAPAGLTTTSGRSRDWVAWRDERNAAR